MLSQGAQRNLFRGFCRFRRIDTPVPRDRRPVFQQGPFTQLEEDDHIEEMHSPEYQDDGARLETELFDELPGIAYVEFDPKGIDGITQVDEIEPYQEQFVDGLRQFFVAMEDVNEKDPAIPEQRTCYPDSKDHGDQEIKRVK
jgi:hypothetical protein